MAQELLYTSAPRGLKPGSRGFCTVEVTSGMSPALVTALEGLSAYRHIAPAGDAGNPVVWSHVLLSLGGRTYSVVSRVADAGNDYTGRTNKLAHHVALDVSERPRGGPAWLMSQPGVLRAAFAGEPRTLGAKAVPAGDRATTVCTAWKAATGDAGWAGVLAETLLTEQGRQAYVVAPPGIDLRSLFEEAIALLPPERRWSATFTTCLTTLPQNVTCLWRGVLAGSKEAHESRRYVQALRIDLTERLGVASGGPLVEAARTGRPHVVASARPAAPPPISAPARIPTTAGLSDELLDEMPVQDAGFGTVRPQRLVESAAPPKLEKRSLAHRALLIAGAIACLAVIVSPIVLVVRSFLDTDADTAEQVANANLPQRETGTLPSSVGSNDAPFVAGLPAGGNTAPKTPSEESPQSPTDASAGGVAAPQETSAPGSSSAPPEGEAKIGSQEGTGANGTLVAERGSEPASKQPQSPPENPVASPVGMSSRVRRASLEKLKHEGDKELFEVRFTDPIAFSSDTIFELWPPKWLDSNQLHIDGQGTRALKFETRTAMPGHQATLEIRPLDDGKSEALYIEVSKGGEELANALKWSVLSVSSKAAPNDSFSVVLFDSANKIASTPPIVPSTWKLPTPIPGNPPENPLSCKRFAVMFGGKPYELEIDGYSLRYPDITSAVVTPSGEMSPEVVVAIRNDPPSIMWSIHESRIHLESHPGKGYERLIQEIDRQASASDSNADQIRELINDWRIAPEDVKVGELNWKDLFSRLQDKRITASQAKQLSEVLNSAIDALVGSRIRDLEKMRKDREHLNTFDQNEYNDKVALANGVRTYTDRFVAALEQREDVYRPRISAADFTYQVRDTKNAIHVFDLVSVNTSK